MEQVADIVDLKSLYFIMHDNYYRELFIHALFYVFR